MAIRKILYPLDLTGSATTNRIENEYVTIGTDKYRAFTLNYAPFYASSLTIKERGKTTLLKAGTDYVVLYYYSELAKLTGGKQICGVVCITNTAIGTDLVVGYNTIGGHYANCASIIEQAIYDLDLDNREAYWQNVIDKPDLFQPTQHLHDIGDVYGLEFIIDCLIGLREAIIIGDNEVHTQIYNRITEAVNEFKSYHATHLANYANPHKVTAHQTGAYTQEEVDALVESLLEDLAALEPRFKVITDNITDVYSKITAVNGTLASLSDRIGYVEQELSKYVMLLTPINQTLASLQGQIDNINTLIAALQAKDVNLQNQINALVTRANNNDTLNGTQNSRLDALESLTSNHETRLDTLESWKTTTNNTLVAYDTRLDNLESKNTTQDNRLNVLESWKTAQQTWDTNTAKSITDLDTRLDTLEAGSAIGELVKSGTLSFSLNVDTNGNQYNYSYGTAAANTGWLPTAGEMYMIVVELSGLVIFSGGCIFGGRNDTVQHPDTVSVQYADSTSVYHPENGTVVTNYMVGIPDRTSLSGNSFGLQLAGSGKSEVYRRGYTGAAICTIMLSSAGLYIKPIYNRHREQSGGITATYKIYKLV